MKEKGIFLIFGFLDLGHFLKLKADMEEIIMILISIDYFQNTLERHCFLLKGLHQDHLITIMKKLIVLVS